ncbi:MAG: glutamate 5-kinase [Candidatus Diapherotrites archaeon]
MKVVVKAGTNSLMENGKVSRKNIQLLAGQVSTLRQNGIHAILVSSGAIGMGLEKMELKGKELDMPSKQAMAAIEQSALMHEYEKAFSAHNQKIAQVLLTNGTFADAKAFANLKHTLNRLAELGVIPIVNENDAIAVEEMEQKTFSDNDGLACELAIHWNANLLVLLTKVGGIYSHNPSKNRNAKLLNGIGQLDQIQSMEGKSTFGLGGAKSKVAAIRKATENGIAVAVCKIEAGALERAANRKPNGSYFEAKRK